VPYVIILNWNLYFSGMWRDLYIVKNGHQNVSHNEIKLCAQNVVTILGSIVSTIGRAHTIIERYQSLHFGPLHLNLILKLENIIFLIHRNSQSDPTAESVCGVRSAPQEGHILTTFKQILSR
jgi:hypothetical protein